MPHSLHPLKTTALWLIPALLLALTACGGGSDAPATPTPPVIRAAQAGSAPVTLHSVAADTGNMTAAVANVSTVSELIVASLTAAEPAALFTQASATPASVRGFLGVQPLGYGAGL